jgi:hypothetical protein
MSSWKEVLLCKVLGCKPDSNVCVCARCGRTNHRWGATPHVESCDYDFCGRNAKGQMVYSETVRHRHVCSRCGEARIKTHRTHVRH